jgi:hypothetical protein
MFILSILGETLETFSRIFTHIVKSFSCWSIKSTGNSRHTSDHNDKLSLSAGELGCYISWGADWLVLENAGTVEHCQLVGES